MNFYPPAAGLRRPPIDKSEPADPSPKPPKQKASKSSSSGYVEEPALQARHFGLQVALSCEVANQPKALVVVNTSSEDLPPGTRIKWQLKGGGQFGFFALRGTLGGGETLVADNVLEDVPAKPGACLARVL